MAGSTNPDGMRWRGVLLEDMNKDELIAAVLQLARSLDAERKQTIERFAFLGETERSRAAREATYAERMQALMSEQEINARAMGQAMDDEWARIDGLPKSERPR